MFIFGTRLAVDSFTFHIATAHKLHFDMPGEGWGLQRFVGDLCLPQPHQIIFNFPRQVERCSLHEILEANFDDAT